MQRIIIFLATLLFTVGTLAAQVNPTPLNIDDFNPLSGLYTGSLTYTDYQNGEIVTMPLVANITVKDETIKFDIEINEGGKRYKQDYSYQLKDGGLKGFEVVSNQNGQLVFTNKGRDNRRPAEFRHTAVVNEQGLRITKEVRFLDEPGADFFIRNQYTYVRLEEMDTNNAGYAAIDGSDVSTANVDIKAGEEFLLGEYTSGGYKVKLSGQGGKGIEVKVINKATKEQTQGFGLSAYGKATVEVRDGEMVILRNASDTDTTVRVKMNKEVEGMRYREVE